MIFVATGTTGFDALVQKMDTLAPTLSEPVVMQIGSGRYLPQQAEYFRFAPSLQPYYERASLVVAHGGMAICLEVLDFGKPLIALSNPDRYDQHQQDILSILAEQNYMIWCRDLEGLPKALQQAKDRPFKRYTAPECKIHTIIADFLPEPQMTSSQR